jgi:toxin-antitoxin system PIN domain toxin
LILPDVNVLLYAFRADSPDHSSYRKWLDAVVNGEMAYGISPQVLAGVVRVATHPRVYTRPSRLADARAFVSALLAQPHCQIIQPGRRHWGIFLKLCQQADTTRQPYPGRVVRSPSHRIGLRVDHDGS